MFFRGYSIWQPKSVFKLLLCFEGLSHILSCRGSREEAGKGTERALNGGEVQEAEGRHCQKLEESPESC